MIKVTGHKAPHPLKKGKGGTFSWNVIKAHSPPSQSSFPGTM